MSDYRELVSILKEILTNRFYPKPEFIRGLLGDGRGNVLVPERPDYNYVRFNRSSTETFEVFNKEVNQPVDGWPVLIGELPWQPGLTQVVGTDWAAYEQAGWGNSTASIQAHAPTHEWPDSTPGSDPLNVYPRALTPLRAYGQGSGSTQVFVAPYVYDWTGSAVTWPGVPPVSLSAATPATGTMRYMGVYLNPPTNTIGLVTGNTTIFTDAIEPPRPEFPANVYPSAFVRLYGGQATVTEVDIRDARRLFHTNLIFTGTSTGGGGAWPFAHVWTVSTTDPDADFSTITAAIAGASAGDVLLLDNETFTEQITVNKSLSIIGRNPSTTIITSASSPTVTISAASCFFRSLTIRNTAAGATNYVVQLDTGGTSPTFEYVGLLKTTGGGTLSAALFDNSAGTSATLRECVTAATSGTTTYGYYSTIACSLVVRSGSIQGGTNAVNAASGSTLSFESLPRVSGSISFAGTIRGMYQDSTYHPFTPANIRLTLGDGATTPPLAMTPRATAPSAPSDNDIYLAVTGTASGLPAFRARISGAWVDLGGGGGVAASQSTVDAGTNTTEFVNPATLANTSLIERAYQSIPYNGSMAIWQRGTSFAAVADGAYTADGWKYRKTAGAMVHTISQSSDVPTVAQAGILAPYSLLVDCTTVDASIAAGDLCTIGTRIEGFDFAQIAQRAFTVSFWVKATKTGIYCISFRNSGADRSYVAEFTINTTATWEYKTITVAASPSAGTWDYVAGLGLTVEICLAGGSNYNTTAGAWQTGSFLNTSNQVNGCDDTANDFRIALFDIVPGSYDRPFPVVDIEEKLARCRRYFLKTYNLTVAPATSTAIGCVQFLTRVAIAASTAGTLRPSNLIFGQRMRAAPTVVVYAQDGTANALLNVITVVNRTGVTAGNPSENGFLELAVDNTSANAIALDNALRFHYTASAEL